MNPRLALVAAVSLNGVIGAGGRMPWRISDDLKRFKAITLGKPIVMGRKTFESIGRPLPGRTNIVVSRDLAFRADGVAAVVSVETALEAAAEQARRDGAAEICVIGGGEIYAATLPLADRIYLTRVAAAVAGDARFPDVDPSLWRAMARGQAEQSRRNDIRCAFFILDRIINHS